MTFDQAVDAAKTGLLMTRPGFMEHSMGWDTVKKGLYTLDHRGHKAQFYPLRADRAATDWALAPSAPR